MTLRHLPLSDELMEYVEEHTTPTTELEQRLIDETHTLGGVVSMLSGHDQGVLLTILTQALDAQHAVEVGTFTGFSALAIARGLREDGNLLCCDVSDEWTNIAQRYWAEAGVRNRITLKLAPALDTLRALPEEPYIDFVFIDAHKPEYTAYWEELVPRMRQGGILAVDNTLWSARVLENPAEAESTRALQEFNDHVRADQRVRCTVLTVGDGVTLAQKL